MNHLLPLGLDHGHVLDPGNVHHDADVMVTVYKTYLFCLLSSPVPVIIMINRFFKTLF